MTAAMEVMTAGWEPLLAHGVECQIMAQNSAPGMVTFTYPLGDDRADDLVDGLLVRVRLTEGSSTRLDLPPFTLQRFTTSMDADRRVRLGRWSGPHDGIAKMRGCLVHTNLFFGQSATFRTGNPGKIISDIKADAGDRGRLVRVGIVGDEDGDADGLPWLGEFSQWMRSPFPRHLMDVIDTMVEDSALEYDLVGYNVNSLEPDETVWTYLRLFNPGNLGTDWTSVLPGTDPVTLTVGGDVQVAPLTESRAERTDSLLGVGRLTSGQTLVATASIADNPVASEDRVEVGHDFGEVQSQADLQRRTDRWLRTIAATQSELVLELQLRPGVPVPLLHLRPGDWINVVIDGGKPARKRIFSASLTRDVDGQLTKGTLVLDGVINARTVGLGRKIGVIDHRQQLLAAGLTA